MLEILHNYIIHMGLMRYVIRIVYTLFGTSNLIKFVSETAKNVFVPLTVGGGIRSIKGASDMFKAGADKILLNSAAIDNIKLLKKLLKFLDLQI